MFVSSSSAAVGVAYNDYVIQLVREEPGVIDYVEMPFEQLVHTPDVAEIRHSVPVILHCASLSIAGNAPPDDRLVDRLAHWIRVTGTPWLGEHIAYVRADGVYREAAEHEAVYVPGTGQDPDGEVRRLLGSTVGADSSIAFNVGYTVSPQMSEPILARVIDAERHWKWRLGVPILLENGPIYFAMPGSTMSQVCFVQKLCSQAADALLLLDLAHLAITAENVGMDPFALLESYPVDRVVEVHLSGTRRQAGSAWDDHSEPAPEIVFDLLDRLLARSMPQAITLEYNWDSSFPRDLLIRDVARVRNAVSSACRARESLGHGS